MNNKLIKVILEEGPNHSEIVETIEGENVIFDGQEGDLYGTFVYSPTGEEYDLAGIKYPIYRLNTVSDNDRQD